MSLHYSIGKKENNLCLPRESQVNLMNELLRQLYYWVEYFQVQEIFPNKTLFNTSRHSVEMAVTIKRFDAVDYKKYING